MYERHDVGTDTLHQVVRENLQTFLSAIEAGFAGGKLPSFVKDELSGYLRCTVLGRGRGLWLPPPEPTAARAPPYQCSVTRLHPSRQAELSFDT